MFSSSVRRAALTAPSQPIAHVVPRAATTSKAISSQCHQRRYSSSKPSSPPADGPKREGELVQMQAEPEKEVEKKSRGGRKKAVKEDVATHNLPSVPSTQHISPNHIASSDFFSLYRPISLTASFPIPITPQAFASIFTPRTKANTSSKSSEVISTLTSTLERFDSLGGAMKKLKVSSEQQTQQPQWNEEVDNFRANITADSYRKAEAKHLDAVNGTGGEGTHFNLAAHLGSTRHFRPFQPPPAPVPQPDFTTTPTTSSLPTNLSAEELTADEPSQRTYTAVLTISESTHANGEVTYTTHSTPLMEGSIIEEPPSHPVRYIERVKSRSEEGIWAISVKRQRKLKMKKHKYKKLMKRTRVLRRKLDRT